MKKLFVLLSAISLSFNTFANQREITIDARYLNFPISHSVDRARVDMTVGDEQYCYFDIRIAPNQADYWVFQDVSDLKGKQIVLKSDADLPLDRIVLCDSIIDGASIGHEPERPQYHFTSRRGWINDPNGLIWHDGLYHLYYQHNPYEREWGNMHWGHATSPDMVHWTEHADALHPDALGTIFSGTATIDSDNLLGKNLPDGTPALVAFYTADAPVGERQCLAYSTDGGMTFTKYPGNPIIDSCERWQSHDRLLTYDMNMNRLQGEFWAPSTPADMTIEFDIYVDRGVVEGFINRGEYSYSLKIDPRGNADKHYSLFGRDLKVKGLKISRF